MRAAFSFDKITIAVQTPRQEDLEWLRQFLEPTFISPTTAPDHCQLKVVIDPLRYHALYAAGPGSAGQVALFTYDNHVANYPSWSDDNCVTTIHDPELRLFYRLDAEARSIELLSAEHLDSMRIALLNLIRELVSAELGRLGWVMLHSAAFSFNQQAIVISGPKEAGKTSLLIHALSDPRCSFISNDRCSIHRQQPSRARVIAIHTVVAIRQGTIELFPEYDLESVRHWRARQLLADSLLLPAVTDDAPKLAKIGLSPAQFCHRLNCSVAAPAALKVLLFPVVDPAVEGLRITPLEPQQIARRLIAEQIPSDGSFLSQWLDEKRPNNDQQTLHHLAQEYRGFECRMGAQAYATPPAELFERVGL